MKSLKRTLCLVLALVMVLGLFGIASATNFTDDNTIQYKEAVEVVTGIGAIKGYDNGTFNPKGTITRAEAAVMVARVALTNAIADDLKGVTSNFTDVTVEGGFSWAIPSIEYLVSKNIINGMGDGTFNPNGQISGYAVLKMLLCVLGYGANDEYVGTGWDLKVAVDANKYGLTAGRADGTPALSASATREEVALYCYNALGNEIVTYNALENRYEKDTGDSAYIVTTPKTKTTLADDVYGIQTTVGVITDNQAVSATQKYTEISYPDGTAAKNYNIKTGADMIGHLVKVYFKDAVTITGGVTKLGTTYSVVDVSNIVKLDKAIDVAGADTAAKKAEQIKTFTGAFGKATDPQTIFADNVVLVGTNCVAGAPIAKGTLASGQTNAGEALGDTYFKAAANGQKANAGTYILDAAGKIVSYIADPVYSVAVISNYKAPTAQDTGTITYKKGADGAAVDITIPKVGDTDKDNPVVQQYALWSLYDGIAKGDVVTIIETGNFKTMVKAPTATGKVTAVNTDAEGTMTMVAGGTTYTKSLLFAAKANISSIISKAVDFTAKDALNQDCVLYLGPDGKVVAAATVEEVVETNLAYVVDSYVVAGKNVYDGNTFTIKVQAIDIATGKEVNYVVGVGGTDNTGAGITGDKGINTATAATFEGKFVRVSTKLNATYNVEVATLTAVTGAEAVTGTSTTNLNVTDKAISGTKCYIGADTQFIEVTADGTNAPTNGTITPLKIRTLTGPQKTSGGKTYNYYAIAADTTGNANVKYVVVLGGVDAAATSKVMFVPEAFTADKVVNYTKADGTAGKAFQNVAFIDGQPTTVLMDAGDGSVTSVAQNKSQAQQDVEAVVAGFKSSYKVVGGIYSDITAIIPSNYDTNKVGTGVVTNVYNGNLRTIAATGLTELSDVPVDSSAFIVDIPYLNDQLNNGGKGNLTNHNSVDKLVGGTIYFTWTGTSLSAADAKITGIYYAGEPAPITFGSVTDAATATGGTAVYTVDNCPATVKVGQTVTLTIKVKEVATGSADKAEVVVLKANGTAVPGATCEFTHAKATTANSTETITFTVPVGFTGPFTLEGSLKNS